MATVQWANLFNLVQHTTCIRYIFLIDWFIRHLKHWNKYLLYIVKYKKINNQKNIRITVTRKLTYTVSKQDT